MSKYNKENYIAKKWDHDRSAFNKDIAGNSRIYLIASDIASGSTYREIAQKYGQEWNVSPSYMRSIITEAIQSFENEDFYKNIKDINNDRLTNIYQEARSIGDLDVAIKAIDKLNKANGVYEQPKTTVQVDNNDNTIVVTFGGPATPEPVINTIQNAPTDIIDVDEILIITNFINIYTIKRIDSLNKKDNTESIDNKPEE